MRGILALLAAGGGGYVLVVRGALTLDLGIGRRVRPLGPIERTIAAPPETVFDVIAAPYLGRTPRAMRDKLRVWERSSDMALAEHLTTAGRLTTSTLETVRFERPHRISFRLLRGPVPHVVETYELSPAPGGTAFVYSGELGTDGWRLGRWWGDRVAGPWERAVATSLASIQAEAERRAGAGAGAHAEA
jgi:Polyketide cyclase / dehydrase and lipid transport